MFLPDRTFAALLFDMDGTILTSIASAERVWGHWARRHGLDVAVFLPTIHGVRSIDTIRDLDLPGVDPGAEAEAITQAEIEDVDDVESIAGAERFLRAIPAGRWAIVTSAPRALAEARMRAADLPIPPILVSAEDIKNGKPAPDGFRLAAERLGVAPGDCLVFEDSRAGIEAADAAGADVIVITQTHDHDIETPRTAIRDYAAIGVEAIHAGVRLVAR